MFAVPSFTVLGVLAVAEGGSTVGVALTVGSMIAGLGLLVLAIVAAGVPAFRGAGAGAERVTGAAFGALDGAAFAFAGAFTSGGALATFGAGAGSSGRASAITGAGSRAAFVLATWASDELVVFPTLARAGVVGLPSSVMLLSTIAPPITVAAMAPIAIPK